MYRDPGSEKRMARRSGSYWGKPKGSSKGCSTAMLTGSSSAMHSVNLTPKRSDLPRGRTRRNCSGWMIRSQKEKH